MDILRHFTPIVYVMLRLESITMRDVKSRRSITEPPIAAVSRGPKPRVLAVGQAATVASARQPADLVNPFIYPHSLLSDFAIAESIIKGMMRNLFKDRWLQPSPIVVLHPCFDPQGGFTQGEIGALRELPIGSGSSRVVLWHGRELTDEELIEMNFQSGGRVLE